MIHLIPFPTHNKRSTVHGIAERIQLPFVLFTFLALGLRCGGGASRAGSTHVDSSAESGSGLVSDASSDTDPFPTGPDDADSDASSSDPDAGAPDVADDSIDDAPAIDADQGKDADSNSVCPMFCEQERALACPLIDPECDSFCPTILRGRCGPQWNAFFICQVKRPLSDFACSPDGEAVPKSGVCADEQMLVNACVRSEGGTAP